MPQKHNPVFSTLVATAARQLPPIATVLFSSMAVEDERSSGGWHAERQPLRECLRIAAGALANAAQLAATLRVSPEAMAANLRLTRGAIVSERVNAALAPLLGKANAKRLLAEVTAAAERQGADVADLLGPALEEALRGSRCGRPRRARAVRSVRLGCPVRWWTGRCSDSTGSEREFT